MGLIICAERTDGMAPRAFRLVPKKHPNNPNLKKIPGKSIVARNAPAHGASIGV